MNKKTFKLMILAFLTMGMFLTGCTTSSSETHADNTAPSEMSPDESAPMEDDGETTSEFPIVTIVVADFGHIKIELYPQIAPNTVNNFISLIESNDYDGVTFHRVIDGFMIQGGDPDGTGAGGPGYTIRGEFTDNGFENTLKHTPGVISMARTADPDSAGSQFFIMHKAAPHLDGAYAAFGQVIEGQDIVDQIAQVETGPNDAPIKAVIMENVSVIRNGYEAATPDKME